MAPARCFTPTLSIIHTSPADGEGGAPEPLSDALLKTPVLIVEDEAVIAWTLESLLEEMGFVEISLAANGRAALAAATARPPGLLLSDINLGPGEDGIATAARIWRDAALPVVFISGHAGPEALARIERATPGARVLRKPVQLHELRAAVSAALTEDQPR